jgi:hypothetical protein
MVDAKRADGEPDARGIAWLARFFGARMDIVQTLFISAARGDDADGEPAARPEQILDRLVDRCHAMNWNPAFDLFPRILAALEADPLGALHCARIVLEGEWRGRGSLSLPSDPPPARCRPVLSGQPSGNRTVGARRHA